MRFLSKPDLNSIRFKLWFYFAVFAVLLMAVLWFLQIFFLETYYEEMKTREIIRASEEIAGEYGRLDLGKMSEYSYKNDLYIHIETENGLVIYTADRGNQRPSMLGARKDTAAIRHLLDQSATGTISFTMEDQPGGVETLVYGRLIDDTPGKRIYLFIFSPLSPVESTVDILADQLTLITIISLLLAFLLSYFLSKNLTKPLISITDAASALGRGEYGTPFEGGRYTEVNRLADSLNCTSAELAKSQKLQKDLLANVSHDLRTPLTMIRSYAEMVRDISGEDPAKRNGHLQVIIDEADRLNRLVTDLLDLSKMQSGVTSLNVEEFFLGDLIENVLTGFEFLSDEGCSIEFNKKNGGGKVKGDQARIRQVVSNLLNNAVSYGGDKKEIVITLSEKEKSVLCGISDAGPGIPPEELDHIWERYYRASDNAGRSSSGTGLGLSIVKEILTLHGAEYGVESQAGVGSTFWFELKK